MIKNVDPPHIMKSMQHVWSLVLWYHYWNMNVMSTLLPKCVAIKNVLKIFVLPQLPHLTQNTLKYVLTQIRVFNSGRGWRGWGGLKLDCYAGNFDHYLAQYSSSSKVFLSPFLSIKHIIYQCFCCDQIMPLFRPHSPPPLANLKGKI